ncbi:MAG: hypothetical protein WBJ84_07580 [Bacteroidales bacterium]
MQANIGESGILADKRVNIPVVLTDNSEVASVFFDFSKRIFTTFANYLQIRGKAS